jgi:hypothetical protein
MKRGALSAFAGDVPEFEFPIPRWLFNLFLKDGILDLVLIGSGCCSCLKLYLCKEIIVNGFDQ